MLFLIIASIIKKLQKAAKLGKNQNLYICSNIQFMPKHNGIDLILVQNPY